MKYIVSESQLKVLLKEDRVTFLRTNNVITKEQLKDYKKSEKEATTERPEGGMEKRIKIEPIQGHDGVDIGYIVTNKKGTKKTIKVTEEVFEEIVDADPTSNKQFVQWMLGVFSRHLNDGDMDQAVRFLSEDLPEANEYLEVFDRVRKKKVFKTGAPNRPNAPSNVTDINQYKDLAHLYSIVSPFIGGDEEEEDGVSPIWKKMKKYIDLGHARMVYRDNDVLVYIPDTIEASCDPLGNLASWCTRREGNSYFKSYRENNKKPDGTNSDLYVVMPKETFEGDDLGGKYPLQFHFETGQLHDKNNSSIDRDGGLNDTLSKYGGLKNFFKSELGALATADIEQGSGLMDSKYLKYLNKFGGTAKEVISDKVYKAGVESIRKLASEQSGALQNNRYLTWLMENTDGVTITDYLDKAMEILDFSNMSIRELPNLSEFKNATRISANDCGLEKLPPADYLPNDLEILTMTGNQLKEVPLNGYEKLTRCFVMNFGKNPINKINVPVLEKLVRESLARFVLADVDLDNLSAANKKSYEKFESDPEGIGYLVA
tara:strand:+ start:2715 stop:4346 length:1632 start_codon:yes stop_codon:yes gene_type:complete